MPPPTWCSAGAPEPSGVGAVYREIDPSAIERNPRQPRQVFDEEALAELVHSIREFGLMQPIVVRAVPAQGGGPRYQLVMGERRWRAAQAAGLATIPAIVRETADDSMLRDALLENIHRVQLNPLEEAAAYQQLLEEFGVTHDELAARIGRSRPLITNMIRLLRLPIAVQRRVAAGVLSAGHARALLALEGGPELQEELATRIVAEGLSVRATEEAVTLANRSDSAAPPAPRRKPIHMPGLQDVAERLSTAFDTRVTRQSGQTKRQDRRRVRVGGGLAADCRLDERDQSLTKDTGKLRHCDTSITTPSAAALSRRNRYALQHVWPSELRRMSEGAAVCSSRKRLIAAVCSSRKRLIARLLFAQAAHRCCSSRKRLIGESGPSRPHAPILEWRPRTSASNRTRGV